MNYSQNNVSGSDSGNLLMKGKSISSLNRFSISSLFKTLVCILLDWQLKLIVVDKVQIGLLMF